MSIDGFITCLTLLVGLYTIAPPLAKLRARLLGWRLWLPSSLYFFTIMYLLFFEMVGQICRSTECQSLIFRPDGLSPNGLAFVIFIAWLGTIFVLFRIRNISIRDFAGFRDLTERLLADRRYAEAVDIIDAHLDSLAKRASRSHWFQRGVDKIRGHGISQIGWSPVLQNSVENRPKPSIFRKIWIEVKKITLYSLKPVLLIVPNKDTSEENSNLIIRRIVTNDDFVNFISRERPIFALRIMLNDKLNYYKFSDRSLGYMIKAPSGPLRQEIWDNGNKLGHFYVIDYANPIIYFLFENAKIAEKLEVYRPIGDYALAEIDNVEYQKFLNSKPRNFEQAKKNDSLFLVCSFFDIMIITSARDRIEWHMWLFYMNIILGRIVSIIDVRHNDYDAEAEFPNFAHYIIYTIIANLSNWIELFQYLDHDSAPAQIDTVEAQHENGHIIKSAILSVGICLKELLNAPNITDKFIAYVLEIVLRVRRNALQSKDGKLVSEALTNSILEGGPSGYQDAQGLRLCACFDRMDLMAKFEHKDLELMLKNKYT